MLSQSVLVTSNRKGKKMSSMSRRDFLRVSGVTAIGALLAACAPAESEPAGTGAESPADEVAAITYMSWGNEEKWASERT